MGSLRKCSAFHVEQKLEGASSRPAVERKCNLLLPLERHGSRAIVQTAHVADNPVGDPRPGMGASTQHVLGSQRRAAGFVAFARLAANPVSR